MKNEKRQPQAKEGIVEYYRNKFAEYLKPETTDEALILEASDLRALPPLPSLADQARAVLPHFLKTGRRMMRPIGARFTRSNAQFDFLFVEGLQTVDVSLDKGEIAYCRQEAKDQPKPLGKALIPVLQDVISAITFSKPVPFA